MAPNKSDGPHHCKPRQHHHHPHHPPPTPGFMGPPGFMRRPGSMDSPGCVCPPGFIAMDHGGHHGPRGFDPRGFDMHYPSPDFEFPGGAHHHHHHRYGGGPFGRGTCQVDPWEDFWSESSDEESGKDAHKGEESGHPGRHHPFPMNRRGGGRHDHRGFRHEPWGPRGGFNGCRGFPLCRGGFGCGGFGRGGFGRGGFGRGGVGRGGVGGPGFGTHHHPFGHHNFHPVPNLPFRTPWSEDSDSSSEDEMVTDYEVTFDLRQFKRKNISVRLAGKHLVVEAKGKESQGPDQHQRDRSCRRYFVEHRILPKTAARSKVTAILNQDGLLTVRAPPLENQCDENMLFCDRQVKVQGQRSPGESGGHADERMDADDDVQVQGIEKDV